jgi:LppX/LprAFG-like lipoprotein
MRPTARPTMQRLTGGLAALALGLSLAACGGSDDSGAVDEPNATDSSATSSAADEPTESPVGDDPADIDEGGEIAPEQFAQMIQDGIEKTKTAHVTFATSGGTGGFSGDGDVDYAAAPPNMQLTMQVTASQELHMLLVDGVMYIESPQAEGKYIKYDLSDPNNPLGANFVDQLDPATAMTQFTQALSSVSSLGDEDVDGETLAHYVMKIDTSKLQTASQSAEMPAELTTDVWLDDENRMAKSSIDLGQGSTYDTTLSDFDKPVDIQAPPDDQVVTQ